MPIASGVLHALFDNALDAVVGMDAQGLVVEWNKQAETTFGWSKEEVLGRRLSEVVIPASHREAHERGMRHFLNSGHGPILNKRITVSALNKNGREFPVELTVTPILQNGTHTFFAFLRDISKQRQHEEIEAAARQQAETAERRLFAQLQVIDILSKANSLPSAAADILKVIVTKLGWDFGALWLVNKQEDYLEPVGIWHDPQSSTLQAFREVCEKFRFRRDEGRPGRTWSTGRATDVLDVGKDPYFSRAKEAQHLSIHSGCWFPIRSGATVYGAIELLSLHVKQSDPALLRSFEGFGEMLGRFLERIEMEDDLRSTETSLREAVRTRDEFFATLSHELRSPLGALVGWSDLVRRTPDDQALAHQALEVIDRNAKALNTLVDDLLDASRIITGKLLIKPQPCDLSDICRSAVDAVRVTAESKGITLRMKVLECRVEVWADPTRVRQVLWNLLTNALKFTSRGGQVEIRIDVFDSEIRLSVRDTGEGIDPCFLPYIFDRFRQADSSSARKHGGLGLGLSIVRYLIETHGGGVSAHSEGKGKGSEFVVTLPRPNIQRGTEEAKAANGKTTLPKQTLRGMKVLVVDDSPDLLTLVEYVLRAQGADVTTASSVSEALLAFQTVRPRMLLSDIAMPDQDGYDLIHQVRAMEGEGPHVPAIALTAYAREDEKQRAIRAGFHQHVPKPLQPEDLISAIVSLTESAASDA